jgi:hypothetical protein
MVNGSPFAGPFGLSPMVLLSEADKANARKRSKPPGRGRRA